MRAPHAILPSVAYDPASVKAPNGSEVVIVADDVDGVAADLHQRLIRLVKPLACDTHTIARERTPGGELSEVWRLRGGRMPRGRAQYGAYATSSTLSVGAVLGTLSVGAVLGTLSSTAGR